MEFSTGTGQYAETLVDLFQEVFATSEGVEEGALIGEFVRALLTTTPEADLVVCKAHKAGELVGAVVFSKMTYAQDDRHVFILSPMAVQTRQQKTGIGRVLITYGLDQLRGSGVDVVLTYGDPAYYAKTGFEPITEAIAQPPLKLSHPHGWLGQSLDGRDLVPLKGPSRCVPALNNPALW